MTIQTAVLIETLKDLIIDLRWCSFNNFSNQYHTVAVIKNYECAAVFSCKDEILKEYQDYILNALIYPEDDGKGHRPDLIVDDGVDMTFLIHEVRKAEELFFGYDTIPDPRSTDISELKILQNIVKRQLEGEEMDKWKKLSIRVWEFLRRPQRGFTICTIWRIQALPTKSEKGQGRKRCVLNNTTIFF